MKQLLNLLFFVFIGCNARAQLVVGVVDADTYKVLINGRIQTVRLMNVDAPELKQHFGRVAADCVSVRILRRVVQLEVHGSDLYGRLLAKVSINGMSLDSLLLARGWAWFYTPYSKELSLSLYEAAAKDRGRGLWACPQPVPP